MPETHLQNLLRWFAGSHVVTPDGNPRVVFHGTAADVTRFDPEYSGRKSGTGAPAGTFFFTDRSDVASSYTVAWQGDFSAKHHDNANVMPVYLNLRRPLKVDARGASWREILFRGEEMDINELAALAQSSGRYDGMVVRRVKDKGVGHVDSPVSTTYVAFSPLQIKSALANSGAFDPGDPDITDRAKLAKSALKWLERLDRKAAPHAA